MTDSVVPHQMSRHATKMMHETFSHDEIELEGNLKEESGSELKEQMRTLLTEKTQRGKGRRVYLLSVGFVRGHVTLQLRAAAEGVGAQRAGEALLVLLVAVLDVLLQRRQALVAAVAVPAGEQLGEVIRRAGQQVCRDGSRVRTTARHADVNSSFL